MTIFDVLSLYSLMGLLRFDSAKVSFMRKAGESLVRADLSVGSGSPDSMLIFVSLYCLELD